MPRQRSEYDDFYGDLATRMRDMVDDDDFSGVKRVPCPPDNAGASPPARPSATHPGSFTVSAGGHPAGPPVPLPPLPLQPVGASVNATGGFNHATTAGASAHPALPPSVAAMTTLTGQHPYVMAQPPAPGAGMLQAVAANGQIYYVAQQPMTYVSINGVVYAYVPAPTYQ